MIIRQLCYSFATAYIKYRYYCCLINSKYGYEIHVWPNSKIVLCREFSVVKKTLKDFFII